jgi:hypothetical protein
MRACLEAPTFLPRDYLRSTATKTEYVDPPFMETRSTLTRESEAGFDLFVSDQAPAHESHALLDTTSIGEFVCSTSGTPCRCLDATTAVHREHGQ